MTYPYPEVENGHIVPAGYLRGFADGSVIDRHVLAYDKVYRRSVESVGVRKRTYSRNRPQDQSRIDDVEWSLSHIDNKVQTVRNAANLFPFSDDDRSVIAQFAGAQLVRVPKWSEMRNAHDAAIPLPTGPTPAPATDSDRLIEMLKWLYTIAGVFYGMQWIPIWFPEPTLIASDHPVVLWPRRDGLRALDDRSIVSVLDTLEIRFALNSQLCLLMTWAELLDPPSIIEGTGEMARNINGFTRANAEDEWFSQPGTEPLLPDNKTEFPPITDLLLNGYNYEHAGASLRRQNARTLAMQVRAAPLVGNPTFYGVNYSTAEH